MNPLLVSVGKFLFVTIIVGTVATLFSPSVLMFFVFAGFAAIGQILLGWVLDRFEQTRRAQYEYQQRLDEQAILVANSVAVKCAGCQAPHSIPIIATERNLFKCRKCEVENVIIVTAEAALTTNPLE